MHAVLRERLKWSLLLRVVVVTLMLGAAATLQAGVSEPAVPRPLTALYILIGLTYALTAAYAILLRRHGQRLPLFAHVQVVHDLVFATITVALTGSLESPFVVLYTLGIVNASLLLYRRGTILAVSLAVMALVGLAHVPEGWLLGRGDEPLGWLVTPGRAADLTFVLSLAGFVAIGALASYLADQLRRASERLEAKSVDLAELEALNRLIVESIQSGLLTVAPDGRVTSFNDAARDITGRSAAEVLGRPVQDLFPGIDLDRPARRERWEVEYTPPSGETLTLGFSVSALRDRPRDGTEADGSLGRIVLFQDLTPYKALEEQVRRADRLAAVGKLAAGMAHEIRNPLASMSGSVQLLKEELVTASAEHRRLMDIIVRETDRLNELITDFLLYARPGSPRREPVDVAAVIDETVALAGGRRDRATTLDVHVDRPLPLAGDARELRQLFWNLLVNAEQAMPGGGRVEVRARLVDGGDVEVTVRDGGEGIAPKDLPKIFDPFFTTKPNGTGLGLAIVHRIVQSHGGAISVASRPNAGTTFTLRLPVAGAASPAGQTALNDRAA